MHSADNWPIILCLLLVSCCSVIVPVTQIDRAHTPHVSKSELANHFLFTTNELLLSHRPCYVDRSSTYTSCIRTELANHFLFITSELLLSHRPCYVDRSSTYISRVKNRVLSEEGYRYFTSVHRFFMTRVLDSKSQFYPFICELECEYGYGAQLIP